MPIMVEPKGLHFHFGERSVILIGLGANLDGRFGPPEQALKSCVAIFAERGLRLLAASSVWKTAPVPASDQPWYRNAVCVIETDFEPLELLSAVKVLERDFGRETAQINAPRVIDLDILAYNDLVNTEGLILPHPRMHERAFVMYPLREVAPKWRHPVLGKSVDDLIASLPSGQDFERMEGIKLC